MDSDPAEAFQTRVDFGYSFATPHRLTVALPNSCDKTLLDCQPGYVRMAWTYEDLTQYPPFAFMCPPTRWELHLKPSIDGHPFAKNSWTRHDGYLPVLVDTFADGRGSLKLEVAGGLTAAITRVTVTNTGEVEHRYSMEVEKPGNWAGMNPAWVDGEVPGNALLAGWMDRADRVLVFGVGADTNPVSKATSMGMSWVVPAGQSRTGWIVRPYRAYAVDLPSLLVVDWGVEFQKACQVWHELVSQATQLSVPDPEVQNAFYACLCDLFIMREPLADGHIVGTPGTELYRAPNSYEAGIVAVALDQVYLHAESEAGAFLPLSLQEPNGDWTEPSGWAHFMWGGAGFKSWVVMEHYKLTRSRQFLERMYPRMRASSRWQARMRAKTRKNRDDLGYGLMPRGMGDCGLKDGDDLYGVFIPHNIWSVYADKLTVEAANILGITEDIPELLQIYQTSLDDLLRAVERGAIQEKDYRWIPGVPGKTSGSRWGVLNALFPCQLLASDHELIKGTLHHIESHLSPGGIPINTGWMADGMWVAITLDNIAEAHLARGEGDIAIEYLYAVLNHGTPLFTWCEERGQEPNTSVTSGDRQHLWTPVAVVRALRDCLVFERGENLELALGIARTWLSSGKTVAIENAPTHFGLISYELHYDENENTVRGHISLPYRPLPGSMTLHIRLPEPLRISSVSSNVECTTDDDGRALCWQHPQGEITIEAKVVSGYR